MRPSRVLRAATSLWLVALLGALATGLPHRHLHGVDQDAHVTLSSADHHSHGMRLVEQGERVPAPTVALPAVAAQSGATSIAPVAWMPDRHDDEHLRPTGRAPPSAQPRAPPCPA